MNQIFDPSASLILERARLRGPKGEAFASLAIDTGSSFTVISDGILSAIGCDPEPDSEKVEVVTGTKAEALARVLVPEIFVLDQTRNDFPMLAHDFPDEVTAQGVLGLDFFRGLRLTIDLREGILSID